MKHTRLLILPALALFLCSLMFPSVASGQWSSTELFAVSQVAGTQTMNTLDPNGVQGWTVSISCDFGQGECAIDGESESGKPFKATFTGMVFVDDDQTATIELDGQFTSGFGVNIDGMAKRDCCPAPTGGAGEVAGTGWLGAIISDPITMTELAFFDSDVDIFDERIRGVEHTGFRSWTGNFDGAGDFFRKGMSASNLACRRGSCTFTSQENFFGLGGTPMGERIGSGTSTGDLADPIFILNSLFSGGSTTPPP